MAVSFKTVVSRTYAHFFGKPEAVGFVFFMVALWLCLYFLGQALFPFLIALVIAYLLEWPVAWVGRLGVGRFTAVLMVFSVFLTALVVGLIGFLPILEREFFHLIQQLPQIMNTIQTVLFDLREKLPLLLTNQQIVELSSYWKNTFGSLAQRMLSFGLASLSGLVTMVVYLVLIPVLVLFFMKDKKELIKSILCYMPQEKGLILRVWDSVHFDLGNYIRGKVIEMFLAGLATYIAFFIFGLQYAFLLSVFVGLSVFFPFVGLIGVTIPVALVGLYQFGLSSDFGSLMLVYFIIQVIDGNVIVPLLFSEAIKIHPVAILLAVFVFGYTLGGFGVFFAIPLAILVKVIFEEWPTK
jgi:putative permease